MFYGTLRIAQAQMPVITDRKECLKYIEDKAARCQREGADILLLPEMFCCPYSVESFPAFAEPQGGPLWQACAGIAEKYHICFSAGTMPERDEQGRIYNTAFVFGPDGKQLARHRKMHLFDIDVKGGQHFRESAVLTPGDSVTTFTAELPSGPVTFGLAVCYDIRFPELFRLMALEGAQVILVPAAFNMTTGPRHWELLFRSQAVNNQVFIAGTAPTRNESSSYISWGHSIIADPWGDVDSHMDAGEDFRITEIDLGQISEVREQIPVLRHRRTDIYELREI